MKEKMITREIVTTTGAVKGMTTDGVASVWNFTVEGDKKDDADFLKAVKKESVKQGFIPVKVEARETTTELYGMPVSEFLDLAVLLDPKTRKPIAEVEAENEEEN